MLERLTARFANAILFLKFKLAASRRRCINARTCRNWKLQQLNGISQRFHGVFLPRCNVNDNEDRNELRQLCRLKWEILKIKIGVEHVSRTNNVKEAIVTMERAWQAKIRAARVDTDECLCIWANVYLLVRPLA